MKRELPRGETVVEVLPYGMRIAQGLDKPRADQPARQRDAVKKGEKPLSAPSATVGGDDAFILAWGRSNEALVGRTRQLALSGFMNLGLLLLVGLLAWRNEQKETYVFVRDALGNVVQANPEAFMQAGRERSEVEIKGFMRRWVVDAWTWTPLDVQDRLAAALAAVDAKAHPVVKEALELSRRSRLVNSGISGRVRDEAGSDAQPTAVIIRTSPLEVMVSFERQHIDRGGERTSAGSLFVRAILAEIPRTPENPYGLVIRDLQVSDRL